MSKNLWEYLDKQKATADAVYKNKTSSTAQKAYFLGQLDMIQVLKLFIRRPSDDQ